MFYDMMETDMAHLKKAFKASTAASIHIGLSCFRKDVVRIMSKSSSFFCYMVSNEQVSEAVPTPSFSFNTGTIEVKFTYAIKL